MIGLVLVVILGFMLWAVRAERLDWNGGLCSKCGGEWVIFNRDSYGGRGYLCSGCCPTRHIWISWPGVDR